MKLKYPLEGLKNLDILQISDHPIYCSQGFGANPQIYKRFGLAGHNGLDIAAPLGTPIHAPHDGHITYGTDPSGYGNYAYLTFNEDGFGWQVVFGHQQRFEGTTRDIKQGEVLGYVNSTGFSTGNHLHFGLKKLLNGVVQDTNNGFNGSIDIVPFMENTMNQAKVTKSKNCQTVYISYPVPSMDFLKERADLEGITIPSPIPDTDSL